MIWHNSSYTGKIAKPVQFDLTSSYPFLQSWRGHIRKERTNEQTLGHIATTGTLGSTRTCGSAAWPDRRSALHTVADGPFRTLAGSGQAAAQLHRTGRFGIIVSDRTMPLQTQKAGLFD